MKRVDRSQELRKDRFRSVPVWAAIICIFAGVSLLSTGHDSDNLFLSILGIVVFLGGGVSFSLPIYIRARRKKSPEHESSWRARLRGLLTFGVLVCALATVGLLVYGLEYSDVIIAEYGILAMWLGIAFFVPMVFLSPSRVVVQVAPAVRLSISDLSDARSLGVEWPYDTPGLWVGIYDLNIVSSLDTRFLVANTPEDHRIFFAVIAWADTKDHQELKNLLEARGDQYLEEFEKSGGEKWHTIFASTRSEDVIRQIFEGYQFYYGTYALYPFIVATGKLEEHMDSLRTLSKRALKGVTREMIETSHCVMVTDWDHGMEMLTNKVSEEQVLQIAKEIAKENALPLLNIADATVL
jgi:hypothetical protein